MSAAQLAAIRPEDLSQEHAREYEQLWQPEGGARARERVRVKFLPAAAVYLREQLQSGAKSLCTTPL